MKIEVNIKKKYFLIFLVTILLVVAGIAAYAYTSNFPTTQNGNATTMGHSADEINVDVGGNVMSLQNAINIGLIGGASASAQDNFIIFGYASASNGQTSANGGYTFSVPAGITNFNLVVVGSGGNGGTGSNSIGGGNGGTGGGGGGGGGYFEGFVKVPLVQLVIRFLFREEAVDKQVLSQLHKEPHS